MDSTPGERLPTVVGGLVEVVVADVVGAALEGVVGGLVLAGARPVELGIGSRWLVVGGGEVVVVLRVLVVTAYLTPLTSVLPPRKRSCSANVAANERATNGRK